MYSVIGYSRRWDSAWNHEAHLACASSDCPDDCVVWLTRPAASADDAHRTTIGEVRQRLAENPSFSQSDLIGWHRWGVA